MELEEITNIKECYVKINMIKAEILAKILTTFEDDTQLLKVDDVYYFLHFKRLCIEEAYRTFIAPLINTKYLKIMNQREFLRGFINFQDIVLQLHESKLSEINNYRYFKFQPINELCLSYENLLSRINNHILSLLKTNLDGLTQKELVSTLSKDVKNCWFFERDYIEPLIYEDKIIYDNYSDYRNGYINRWDLRVKLKVNK